jgi:hypothetical protein
MSHEDELNLAVLRAVARLMDELNKVNIAAKPITPSWEDHRYTEICGLTDAYDKLYDHTARTAPRAERQTGGRPATALPAWFCPIINGECRGTACVCWRYGNCCLPEAAGAVWGIFQIGNRLTVREQGQPEEAAVDDPPVE